MAASRGDTIPHRVLRQAALRPSTIAYEAKVNGRWQPTTWRTYVDQIRTAARAMIALGLPRGGKVSILGFNKPEWVIFDHAAMMAGGCPAGIYTTCSADEVEYIIHHSESLLVLVENADQLAKVKARRAQLPLLQWIVMMKGATATGDDVLTWDDFLARAESVPETELDKRVDAIEQSELATLIYTSGTTGPPKGVMLSHRNLAWTAQTLLDMGGRRTDDVTLSYLPLSHIAEQMVTVHMPATRGSTVYFAESIDKVPDNLKDARPTVFFGVPRIWEKFHAGITAKLAQATGAKKYLVAWTRLVCTDVNARRARGEAIPPLLDAQYRLVKKLVLDKLKPALGLGAAPENSSRARSKPIAVLTFEITSRSASRYCSSSGLGIGSPALRCALTRAHTPRAQSTSRFLAPVVSPSFAVIAAWNFSQILGTPKNTVGRASRRFSGTFSIDSAK